MSYHYEIVPETNALNPRTENDNFCHLSLFHRKFNLGDDDARLDFNDFNGWDEVKTYLEDEKDAHLVLKVSATDHSCFRVYLGEPKDPWDSGVVGFAWVTEQEIINNFGDNSHESIDKAKKLIEAELEEYDKYLNGEYVQVIVYDDDNNVADSCGNFGDEESAKEWAEETIKDLQHDEDQEKFTPYEQMKFDF